MSHDFETAYAIVEVSDLEANAAFFSEVIGLAASPAAEGTRAFTNDEAVHRITVVQGTRDDLVAYGIEAMSPASFEATLARLSAAGYAPVENADLARRRSVDRLVEVATPFGAPIELVLGLERGAAPALPHYQAGFVTKGQGFGHVVVATEHFDATSHLFTEVLGFSLSDWIETEIMEGITIEVRFFHCNARHHSFALAKAPFALPTALHHLMVEAGDRDDVGRAFDRTWATTLGIANGLGVHDNDQMFSFYVIAPGGYQVEVGYGAKQITEPWDQVRGYDQISIWGHQPLRLPG